MGARKYREKDRGSLLSLWEEVFPDSAPHNKAAVMLEAKVLIDDLIFVFEEQEVILAACMAGYDGHRGWLYAVAVSPERRREGLGRIVIESALRALGQVGCVKVNLQVRATNAAVTAFYESLGFTVEDRVSMGRFVG